MGPKSLYLATPFAFNLPRRCRRRIDRQTDRQTDDRLATIQLQWCRQLWGSGARAPSTSSNFIFILLWSKSDGQLSKYCVVYEISWCKCQQLTALSISTALVTKLLVIEQLLHPAAPSPEFCRECPMT